MDTNKGLLHPPVSKDFHLKPLPIDISERPPLTQEEFVHNFAFGSNMGPEKLKVRAGGIETISAEPGFVHDYRLAFNLAGVPPNEPVMAGIQPEAGATIHGTLYKLKKLEYEKLYRSEGGGASKRRVYLEEEVTVQTYSGHKVQAVAFKVRPEVALPRKLEVPASKRYLDLLVEGAKSIGLKEDYVRGLEELPRAPSTNGLEKLLGRCYATFFFFWIVKQLPGLVVIVYLKQLTFKMYAQKEVCRQASSPFLRPLAYPLLVLMLLSMLPGCFVGAALIAARSSSKYVASGWRRIKLLVPEREAKELKVA